MLINATRDQDTAIRNTDRAIRDTGTVRAFWQYGGTRIRRRPLSNTRLAPSTLGAPVRNLTARLRIGTDKRPSQGEAWLGEQLTRAENFNFFLAHVS